MRGLQRGNDTFDVVGGPRLATSKLTTSLKKKTIQTVRKKSIHIIFIILLYRYQIYNCVWKFAVN